MESLRTLFLDVPLFVKALISLAIPVIISGLYEVNFYRTCWLLIIVDGVFCVLQFVFATHVYQYFAAAYATAAMLFALEKLWRNSDLKKMAFCVLAFLNLLCTAFTWWTYYDSNIVELEPTIVVTRTDIVSAEEVFLAEGDVYGHIGRYGGTVNGSVSEIAYYRYFYQKKNGGTAQDFLPGQYTELIPHDGEEWYFEKIVTTKRLEDRNVEPPKPLTNEEVVDYFEKQDKEIELSKTAYILYVPKSSELGKKISP